MKPSKDEDKFPKYLYKFRYFDDEGKHLRILSEKELFLASPDSFNDPFDCKPSYRLEDGTRDQMISYFVRIAKMNNPSWTSEQSYRIALDFYQRNKDGLNERKKAMGEYVNSLFSQKVGIFCLSSNYRSILSWSHYANSHRGYCIGFETMMLIDLCNAYSVMQKTPTALMKVDYDNRFPAINPYTDSNDDRLRKHMLRKSQEWEYENEYRIILTERTNLSLKIEDLEIGRVLLGCQISPENKDSIISVLKEKHPDTLLFQAEMKEEEYGLQFRLVKY